MSEFRLQYKSPAWTPQYLVLLTGLTAGLMEFQIIGFSIVLGVGMGWVSLRGWSALLWYVLGAIASQLIVGLAIGVEAAQPMWPLFFSLLVFHLCLLKPRCWPPFVAIHDWGRLLSIIMMVVIIFELIGHYIYLHPATVLSVINEFMMAALFCVWLTEWDACIPMRSSFDFVTTRQKITLAVLLLTLSILLAFTSMNSFLVAVVLLIVMSTRLDSAVACLALLLIQMTISFHQQGGAEHFVGYALIEFVLLLGLVTVLWRRTHKVNLGVGKIF